MSQASVAEQENKCSPIHASLDKRLSVLELKVDSEILGDKYSLVTQVEDLAGIVKSLNETVSELSRVVVSLSADKAKAEKKKENIFVGLVLPIMSGVLTPIVMTVLGFLFLTAN